jgi:hypothetical protein
MSAGSPWPKRCCCSESLPDFNPKKLAIYSFEGVLGGRSCQALPACVMIVCLVETTSKVLFCCTWSREIYVTNYVDELRCWQNLGNYYLLRRPSLCFGYSYLRWVHNVFWFHDFNSYLHLFDLFLCNGLWFLNWDLNCSQHRFEGRHPAPSGSLFFS